MLWELGVCLNKTSTPIKRQISYDDMQRRYDLNVTLKKEKKVENVLIRRGGGKEKNQSLLVGSVCRRRWVLENG